jgi:hypothetical protein
VERKGLVTVANASDLARRFADANVAIVMSHSHLIAVDVDEPSLKSEMLRRFGPTPLMIRSGGSGGVHLLYRAVHGVTPTDLRDTEGIAVEIKAAGTILVVPPSVHRGTGRAYKFLEGA